MNAEAANLTDSKPQSRRSPAHGARRRRSHFVAAAPVPLPRPRTSEARGEENVQATAADLRAPKPRFTALRATAYFAIAVVGVFATLSTVAGLDRLENWHNALPGRLINDGRQFPLATWRDRKPPVRIVPPLAKVKPRSEPLRPIAHAPPPTPPAAPAPRRKDAVHPAVQVEAFAVPMKPLPKPAPPPAMTTATAAKPPTTTPVSQAKSIRHAPQAASVLEPLSVLVPPTPRPALSDDEPVYRTSPSSPASTVAASRDARATPTVAAPATLAPPSIAATSDPAPRPAPKATASHVATPVTPAPQPATAAATAAPPPVYARSVGHVKPAAHPAPPRPAPRARRTRPATPPVAAPARPYSFDALRYSAP